MKRIQLIGLAVLLPVLLLLAVTQSARAGSAHPEEIVIAGISEATASDCEGGRQESGAEFLICTPDPPDAWNGDLIVYAHGYVAPDSPVGLPADQMVIEGFSITETVSYLGYGFATTSYYTNGLAVRPAISDLLDVVDIFTARRGEPDKIYLLGVSEGGLISTLSVEQHPDVYDGGLAMCGPYGDFQGQINHFGDFRIVFDYFFPGLMPIPPLTIPNSFVAQWESGHFADVIEPVVFNAANSTKVDQLLNVTGVSPFGYDLPESTDSIERLLWYNVYATEDGKRKLGGQPMDNQTREYHGSLDDQALNEGVARFSADQEALDAISEYYQTTGELSVPLVTLHTTGDPVVPYWHATQYASKTLVAGSSDLHASLTVTRHGHCSFHLTEIVQAFNVLVEMVATRHRVFLPMVLRAH